MATVFGLYFGNTNLCLAVHKDGKTDVVANDAGDRVTPAIVAFVNGERCVGLPAKQRILRFPSSTVQHLKQALEVTDFTKEDSKHKVEDGEDVRYYTSEEVLVFLFMKMHAIAIHCDRNNTTYPAVVTVPVHFSDEQRAKIKKCAEKAGFEILRVINEPTASALAYDVGHPSSLTISNCLVYRIGATSVDITIIQVIGGTYRIISRVRRTNLGGDSFTRQLVDFCVQEFQRQYKVDVRDNKRAMAKLWNVAESCKHGLAIVGTALCCAESLYDGIDLNLNVSRARYESLIAPVVLECLAPITEAINEAGLTETEVHKVVLSGGSSKIVLLQQSLKSRLESAEILQHLSPDEVVAFGAAKQAALTVTQEDPQEIEALTRTIYLKTVDSNSKTAYLPIIPQGTPVPTKWHQKLTLSAQQTSVAIDVYEGITSKEGNIDEPVHLAKVVMKDIPAGSDLPLTLQIKTDGNLYISCLEKTSNKVECVTVRQAVKSTGN